MKNSVKRRKNEEQAEKEQFKKNLRRQKFSEKRQQKMALRNKRNEWKEERKVMQEGARQQAREERQRIKALNKKRKKEEKLERKKIKELLRARQAAEMKASLEKRKIEKKDSISEKQQAKKEKREERKKLRKQSWEILRSLNVKNMLILFRYFLGIPEDRKFRNSYFVITLNSLVLFVLSYFVIFYIGQFITLLVAQSFDYNLILFYHKIYYSIAGSDWTPDAIKILYSLTPIVGFVLGLISIIIYSLVKETEGILKTFFLWSFINGMSIFFGAVLFGTLLNQGIGWSIAWLYYRDTGKMIFAILSLFFLIAVGGFSAKSLFISGNTYFNFIDKSNKKFFFFSQVMVPILLGSLIIIAIKFPNNFYYQTQEETWFEIFKTLSVLIIFIPVIFLFNAYETVYFSERERNIRIAWPYIIVVIILILGIRIGLSAGLILK